LVRKQLERPYLTLHQHRQHVERLAVVAGGGDLPDLLQMAYDHGCDTLLTGTVENRFAVPVLQELNRKFHKLNSELKLNLIGGTHFGTERPAMIRAVEMLQVYEVPCEYCEDEDLLNAL
jgi:putative NIF3 family GTP cyclohydrolase 1 type 2